ncbi:hypothetical protein Ahy_A03g010560 isoform B [Arachis hypogaea]|uniref:Large ribosomal subunit protein bL32m n=1 Tax=Arachis hypogaea TaxID=3818 RepID=A0A445DMK4_ARAHY|nr:hypothetical protein Ahy_A03g010560 isoform B [Arachis hypogaea]
MAAARFAVLKITGGEMGSILGFRRWMQSVAQSPPLAGIIDNGVQSSQSVLPEFSSQSSYLGGSLELMAVPKKKISKHKRGIRNGPKALKPTPVIVLCNEQLCGVVAVSSVHTSTVVVENGTGGPNDQTISTLLLDLFSRLKINGVVGGQLVTKIIVGASVYPRKIFDVILSPLKRN